MSAVLQLAVRAHALGAGRSVSLRWQYWKAPRGFFRRSLAGSIKVPRRSVTSLLARAGLVPCGVAAVWRGWGGVAHCRRRASEGALPSRLLGREKAGNPEPKFDWGCFWSLLLPDLTLLVFAVVAALGAAVLNIYIPLNLGQLVNTVAQLESGREWSFYGNQLMQPGMRLVMLYSAQSVCTFCYITLLSVIGERLAVRLRTRLFHSLVQQDIAFFDSHRTGELVSRLSGDVQDFKSSFKLVVSQGLRSLAQVCGCVVSLYLISPQMTGVVAVALPTMIGAGSLIGAVLRKWSREAQEQVAMATAVADEALGNVRTVRAFAMEDKETSLYSAELRKSEWYNERLGVGIAFFQALSNLAINGIVLAVVSYGGLLLATDKISPGDLMSFLVATQTIQRSLGSLSVLFGQMVRGVSAGSRVFEYVDLPPSVLLTGGLTVPLGDVRGCVQFQDVQFAYPNRPDQVVLENFSLVLPAGKITALCGLSGAGKSTIAALLERFYDPKGGRVLLDGRPLSSLDPSWLRGEVIGFISQEPVLFATSIMENIRYGKATATDEEVFAAARLANADTFIREFPKGYQTSVGERGVALSGGQKQRVAIARALLKNPCVLILDEATSALDAQSERMVQEALDRATEGRTVLVIAHRLSTIRDADCIAVIHHGRLRELGSHSELLAKGGVYAELIRRQTSVQ